MRLLIQDFHGLTADCNVSLIAKRVRNAQKPIPALSPPHDGKTRAGDVPAGPC